MRSLLAAQTLDAPRRQAWTASGLKKTLKGFAEKYDRHLQKFGADYVSTRTEFWFVTNRAVNTKVVETVDDAANGTAPRHPAELKKLKRFTGLADAELSSFCRLLHFEDGQDDYWNQRNILRQEVSGYLPGPDSDAPVQLKELVTRKALPEASQNPLIEKIDVLRALGTDESSLYPAPCQITAVDNAIPREQEVELIREILRAEDRPIVVHALAGVGKSVFAKQIQKGLPEGSVSILYDCFGGGQYRRASGSRHRHRDALVQIANELAARSLCHPLIPAAHANATDYVRAFIARVNQAVGVVRGSEPAAVLCIVIDAADNAEQAARERSEAPSFTCDLLRETLPEGARLVVLCRSHRQELLDPPPNTLRLELKTFTAAETGAHLRRTFPDATDPDVEEFHRLSSQNPRVQWLALSRRLSLSATLRELGPNPTTVDGAIENLLSKAVERLRDDAGSVEREHIDRVCAGLAVLRPLVPIAVLSEISGVSQEAIRSFALDIGGPLLVAGDAIQFRDEPVETWFHRRYKPPPDGLTEFVNGLIPMANGSAYVAAVLPQLMLEAGQLPELLSLALTSSALPATSEMEKRAVELGRAQFALKAALRTKRYADAAKLALKAGEQTAGDSRRRKLIQSNTDLAARFFEPELVQEIVSRRVFDSGRRGWYYVYEAGLLSSHPEFIGEARSRLRMAYEWLDSWCRLNPSERQKEEISDDDIAELVMAQLNVHGPDDAARAVGAWRPRSVSFRAGRIVVRRLLDHDRVADANGLVEAAGDNHCLVLAVILELREIHRVPPVNVVEQAFRRVRRLSAKARKVGSEDRDETMDAVTALVEAAFKLGVCSRDEAAKLLTRYLPATAPRGVASRVYGPQTALLRAYSLQAALRGDTLALTDLAHPELKTELERKSQHHSTQEVREFKRDVGALLPWYRLWAAVSCGDVSEDAFPEQLRQTRTASETGTEYHYPEGRHVAGEIALVWFDVLHLMDATDAESVDSFGAWIRSLRRPLFTPALHSLARLGARREATRSLALELAGQAFRLAGEERTAAGSKSDSYVDVARAVLAINGTEAKTYFDEAVAVANKVGDENVPRWEAILNLADRAARPTRPIPDIAYKFARCAELTYDYVVRDKHFDWHSTMCSLASLCPSSSFAILSRWRDRRFGWTGRVLPVVTEALIERGCLDPRDALPLVGFDARWKHADLLDTALARCTSKAEKTAVERMVFRYARCSVAGVSSWKKLREVAGRYGLSVSHLDELVSPSEGQEHAASKRSSERASSGVEAHDIAKPKWDEVFSGHDLTTAEGIAEAYAAFKRTPKLREHKEFFAEAILRVLPGAEAEFVTAVGDTPTLSLYSFSDFLEQVPDGWLARTPVHRSLESAIKTVCRRYCMKVTKYRYYETAPFDAAFKRTGVREKDVIDAVLDAVGKSPELADSDRLFSLVGLLTSTLTGDQALDALAFGLGLFDGVLEPGDGDGPWSEALTPPATVEESLAGYIYAGLAAPAASVRWEAAHAVVGMCALGRNAVLGHLMNFTDADNAGPFADARLPFYRLHAFQWLMIACARAAQEHPTSFALFARRFADWALDDQPHVMVRQFAARAALALLQVNVLPADDQLEQRLRCVNISSLPVVKSKRFLRISRDTVDADATDDEDRFYFYMDIGPYWYKPLGEVFGLSQRRIETEALAVIRNELHSAGDGKWREDERRRRKLYGRDRHGSDGTDTSHGSYPDTDDYEFYLAYHAMMIVAGRRLATTPTHRDIEWDERDEFAEWLSRHDLTRNDGRWLADRRDPAPLERPTWLSWKKGDTAYGTVTRADFDEAFRDDESLNVWGCWSSANNDCVQTVRVQSALVSTDRSAALLRALSNAADVHDYVIPSADCDHQIDRAGFALKGWIEDRSCEKRMDGKDKWCGGVCYPPPAPAVDIVELMAVEADSDRRVWRNAENEPVMSSQAWGNLNTRDEDDNPERGERLRASLDFVTNLLGQSGFDLIIEVQIERIRRWRWYDPRENDDERIPTNARLYLITASGHVTSL